MVIPELISEYFGSEIRQSGMDYYRSGKIEEFTSSGNKVSARVRGEYLYDVDIVLSGANLEVYCDCDYFHEHIYCKHIWAVIVRSYTEKIFEEHMLNKVIYVMEYFGEEYLDYGDGYNQDESVLLNNHKSTDVVSGNSISRNSPSWKSLFSDTRNSVNYDDSEKQKLFFYYLRMDKTNPGGIPVDLVCRYCNEDGSYSVPLHETVYYFKLSTYKDKKDQAILSILLGKNPETESLLKSTQIKIGQAAVLVQLMAETGRLYIVDNDGAESGPVKFDKTVYHLKAVLERADPQRYGLSVKIISDEGYLETDAASSLWSGGLVVIDGKIAKLDCGESGWPLMNLKSQGVVYITNEQIPDFLHDYYSSRERIPVVFPDELKVQEEKCVPVPCLRFLQKNTFEKSSHMIASVYFDYRGIVVGLDTKDPMVYNKNENKIFIINRDFQGKSIVFLYQSGIILVNNNFRDEAVAKISKKQFIPLVKKLLEHGWRVEGEKGVFKRPGTVSVKIKSGVDWFDLRVSCSYDNTYVPLPKLLAALKKGEQYVVLDDGTLGLLPEEWLQKYGVFTSLGDIQDDSVRFKHSQALLIDSLVAEHRENISTDAIYNKIRKELVEFDGIEPLEPPESVQGSLRPYQKEGLGWLAFLERFGLGGCLADDMGLGKTVQVLSHLVKRKESNSTDVKSGTSLVVAPRSLIFIWIKEIQKFTPSLKILDFSGVARSCQFPDFTKYDIVLVTYGTLRRDITRLKEFVFDYVILDEAQVIKNAKTITAKSACVLCGRNRLALSGTPVENHLGDLWSIFDFLNPGILGSSAAFAKAQKIITKVDDEAIKFLRNMLRPFILRRTKSQVAKDLPERTEEIVLCEMEPAQEKIYEELKKYYQANLLKKVEIEGINKSKIMILEALLRLRQAACHPGLIDKKNRELSSVKLETLVSQIEELREEGHKCIVFSQFTSMLAIVKERLDKTEITYEYLDGSTKDRQAGVERFQNDPLCGVFLVSLKAGGVGLNLTAADYVFLFDPWWNPAVEAQAIDRTHRIGQKKPVFAYRLICKNTVEEKVLELQSRKKKLSESIISNDESIIKNISISDLKMLIG